MFRLKLLVFLRFGANICTFIWFVCNLSVPLHQKISNTYANEKKNPNSTAVFGTIRHTEENLPEKPNEKKPSK